MTDETHYEWHKFRIIFILNLFVSPFHNAAFSSKHGEGSSPLTITSIVSHKMRGEPQHLYNRSIGQCSERGSRELATCRPKRMSWALWIRHCVLLCHHRKQCCFKWLSVFKYTLFPVAFRTAFDCLIPLRSNYLYSSIQVREKCIRANHN